MELRLQPKHRKKVLLTTAVWGEWHVRAFLDLAIPALIAPGNLPALSARHSVTWQIHTTPEDQAVIEKSPHFAAIACLFDHQFVRLSREDIGNPIATHHRIWRLGAEQARQQQAFAAVIPPDGAWSDGTFAHFAAKLSEGVSSIMFNFMRVESTSFMQAYRACMKDGVVAIPPRRMVRMALESLHPLMGAYHPSSPFFPSHAEYIKWAVPGEGMMVRQLGRELFIFDATRFDPGQTFLVQGPFCPDELYIVTDSDNGFGVGIVPVGKDFGMHDAATPKHPIAVARWWEAVSVSSTEHVIRHPLRWHYTDITESKWRAVENGSAVFLHRVAAMREGLELWREAVAFQQYSVARLLAYAIGTGGLARAFPRPGRMVVFLPTEAALAELSAEENDAVFDPSRPRVLRAFLRSHAAPYGGGGEPITPLSYVRADVETYAGGRVRLTTNSSGSAVVNGLPVQRIRRLRNILVCWVDRLLVRPTEATGAAP